MAAAVADNSSVPQERKDKIKKPEEPNEEAFKANVAQAEKTLADAQQRLVCDCSPQKNNAKHDD